MTTTDAIILIGIWIIPTSKLQLAIFSAPTCIVYGSSDISSDNLTRTRIRMLTHRRGTNDQGQINSVSFINVKCQFIKFVGCTNVKKIWDVSSLAEDIVPIF